MRSITLLGAPGAGKGTIARQLCEDLGCEHLSTGHILRQAVADETPVGRKARSYMDEGRLVPDDIVVDVVREVLESRRDAFVVFDGFPRTLRQGELLDGVLEGFDAPLESAYLLNVPESELIDRLSGRRVCRECGAVYHVRNMPPAREGLCDRCGGELIQREDDREDTIRTRLRVYEEQTADLIGYYEQQDKLQRVDGLGGPQDVARRLLDRLSEASAS